MAGVSSSGLRSVGRAAIVSRHPSTLEARRTGARRRQLVVAPGDRAVVPAALGAGRVRAGPARPRHRFADPRHPTSVRRSAPLARTRRSSCWRASTRATAWCRRSRTRTSSASCPRSAPGPSRPPSSRSSKAPTSRRSAWRCDGGSSAPSQPVGPAPYLLAGTPLEERLIGSSADKDETLAAHPRRRRALRSQRREGAPHRDRRRRAHAQRRLRRAPRRARQRHWPPRTIARTPVTLAAQAQVRARWGCDGRTFVVSVADRFGALDRATVAATYSASSTRARPGSVAAAPAAAPASAWCSPTAPPISWRCRSRAGRFTEATAALHVAGSNRAAVARGSALHIFD